MATIPAQKSVSGPYYGIAPPKFRSGQSYLPTGYAITGETIATGAADLYYYPFWCPTTQTFTGAKSWNQGAGDNGETFRMGIYKDDGSGGGPGTLVIDFGQVTLTGAAALRTLASAVTLPGGQWYWFAQHFNSSMSMFGMSQSATAVGPTPPLQIATGYLMTTSPSATLGTNYVGGFFVNTTYGALAATAVAPSAELSGLNATGRAVPIMGIYV